MRIGLIGDVHAEDRALRHALDFLSDLAVAQVLCTGDIPDGPGSVTTCCELLQRFRVQTVRGNHERWLLANSLRDLPGATDPTHLSKATIDFLRRLPATIDIDTVCGPLMLCHGLGSNDMASVGPDDFGYALDVNDDLHAVLRGPHRIVVNGHTHKAMVRAFGSVTIVNAGTLCRAHRPGFAVLDCDAQVVSWYAVDESGGIAHANDSQIPLR